MTDKEQIIIDGVDVIGCDFIAKEDIYCSYSGEYTAYKGQCGCSDEEMCKNNPKCFYKKTLKQLSRKTQECEELKDTLRTLTRGVVLPTPEPEVIDLTDRYRKALAPFQDEYFKGLDTTAIAELAKKSIRLTTENRKLETALDEIEEMLQVIVKSNKVYPLQSNLYKILNIISKAKGEENAR